MSENNQEFSIKSPRPWIMWGLGAMFFFVMYLARVSPGVMSQHLMHDFRVSAFALGSLSVFFFYPYVLMQVPVGILTDRFGPRRLLTVMTLLCAVACYMFSRSDGISMASTSRLLLGFGSAFAFVGALKLASVWFPPRYIGLLAGLTQTLGDFGAAVGEGPISILVEGMGWRDTLVVIGLLFIILSVLIALIVRDFPTGVNHANVQHLTKGKDLFAGAKTVLTNSQTWINGIYAGLLYAPTAAFAELWGNSFLKEVYEIDLKTASTGISLIFIGWGIGAPLIGWISDRMGKRKPMMYFSAIASCILMTIFIFYPHMPIWVLFSIMFVFGMVNTGVIVAYAVASEINPHRVAGTSLAVANMLSIMVGALFQPLVGWLIDLHAAPPCKDQLTVYTAADYRFAMLVFPACLILSLFCIFLIKETNCQEQITD